MQKTESFEFLSIVCICYCFVFETRERNLNTNTILLGIKPKSSHKNKNFINGIFWKKKTKQKGYLGSGGRVDYVHQCESNNEIKA